MLKETFKAENSPENIKKICVKYYHEVYPFYNSYGHEHTIRTKNSKISCRLFVNPNAHSKVLIVTGYNESYLKYAEVIYDLYHKGYSVYAYDHRGQGFSQKFPNQQNRGFLNSFEELVNDLEFYFNFVDKNDKKLKVFILAHSMGGAVTSLAALQNRIAPTRIALSSPMFGITLTPFPILEYPVYLIARAFSKLGFAKTYAFGQTDCFPLQSFEKNRVTHSRARYKIWQAHIRETPEVQLGGPTFQWIRESVQASRLARTLGQENQIPILLLQAENDTVVRNDTQDLFIKNCANSEKKIIHSAKHEILMEVDSLRDEVFKYILDFFE